MLTSVKQRLKREERIHGKDEREKEREKGGRRPPGRGGRKEEEGGRKEEASDRHKVYITHSSAHIYLLNYTYN